MAKILFIHKLGAPEHPSSSIEILSSFLKLRGHTTNLIVDFNDSYFTCRLYKRIKEYRPDLIGFSVLTPMYRWTVGVSKLIKAKYNIPIVFGNIHASALPEYVLSDKSVNFVIRGEGEKSLSALMDLIDKKSQDYTSISNLCYTNMGKIVCNPIENVISNLDTLPFPDKSITRSEAPFYDDIYYCLTERGCPYSCTFCFNHFMKELYNKKGNWARRRSVENVIEELKIAKKEGYKFVHFDDDCFARNTDWLAEFVNRYKKDINIPFQINSRIGHITTEIARLLSEAGCLSVKMGIQTTSGRLLRDICNRGIDQNIVEGVKNLKKFNIIVKVDTMFNLPTQSEDDIIKDMEFYNKLRPDFICTFNLIYFPKTNIVDIGIRHGVVTKKDIEKIKCEGLTACYIRDKKLLYFMELIPHLPTFIIKFILQSKLWNKIPHIIYKYKFFLQLPYYLSNKNRLGLTLIHIRRGIRFKYYLLRLKNAS